MRFEERWDRVRGGGGIHVQGTGAGQEGGGEDEEAGCELHGWKFGFWKRKRGLIR